MNKYLYSIKNNKIDICLVLKAIRTLQYIKIKYPNILPNID